MLAWCDTRGGLVILCCCESLKMLNSKEKSFFAYISPLQRSVDFKVDLFLLFSDFSLTKKWLFWAGTLLDREFVLNKLLLYWSKDVVDQVAGQTSDEWRTHRLDSFIDPSVKI